MTQERFDELKKLYENLKAEADVPVDDVFQAFIDVFDDFKYMRNRP